MSQQEPGSQSNNTGPPVRKDKEIEIKRLELEQIGKYLSSGRQKTEISVSERILISLLYQIAENPFRISEKIARKRGIPFDPSKYVNTFFKEVLDAYIEFGIPLNRKGRKEDGEVLSSYFEAQYRKRGDDKVPGHLK